MDKLEAETNSKNISKSDFRPTSGHHIAEHPRKNINNSQAKASAGKRGNPRFLEFKIVF